MRSRLMDRATNGGRNRSCDGCIGTTAGRTDDVDGCKGVVTGCAGGTGIVANVDLRIAAKENSSDSLITLGGTEIYLENVLIVLYGMDVIPTIEGNKVLTKTKVRKKKQMIEIRKLMVGI
ncbi:hypothetical protein R1sor_006079 [Riccia sorocarpa]|uniref:Uncharacterized protein n=1 Tax=Riccia sorocarpa TaxID=122646 RepID=A0ABD3HM03_9MARC